MDARAIVALLELGLAILIGVMVLYIAYSVINQNVFKKHGIEKDNMASAILVSAILFAAGNIISGALDPIGETIRLLTGGNDDVTTVAINAMKYIFAFIFIGIVIAFITIAISIKLFTTLTKIDEFEEISKGNMSPAIITGTIAIIISIFAKIPAIKLMKAIGPYPDFAGIH